MNVLPWQQDAWQGLVQRRNNNGMPHATLVTGAAGIGKHHLSLVVAQWLLCQKPTNDGACHQCHSCHLWNAGNHPDFILCEPEEGSRQIRIDIIRRVNAFIAQTPQISPCQVVVMRPVEVMNTNAANALLKTLEEPAGESFLLLETERFGSVLPTIRSRCQRLTLGLPPIELALQWLLSQGVVDTDARHALQRCQGAPLKALRWIKEGVGKTEGQLAEQLQQWSTDNLPLEAIASKWVKHEFSELIAWWYQLSCDLHK
ncbi:MAG: DNA polymerase III subunit delta', partial [Oleibacter sp.]|nr:DNA polymerase III subunit delta' [Thalassolituus sp.]